MIEQINFKKRNITEKNKKKVIGIFVIVMIMVISVITVSYLSQKNYFRKISEEIYDLFFSAYYYVLDDGQSLLIDTNPFDDEFEDLELTEMMIYQAAIDDGLEAIQYVNKKLGFSDELFTRMMETNSYIGRQAEENKKFIVSWTYHPEDGLEVLYKHK